MPLPYGFSSGPGVGKWSPDGEDFTDVGATAEGFRVRLQMHMEPIQTDEHGQSRVNGVLMGGDVEINFESQDYTKSRVMLTNTLGSTWATSYSPGTNVGLLMSDEAGQFFITPKAGTTNAARIGVGKSLLFYCCLVLTDFEEMIRAGATRGPVTILCIPDPTTGKVCEVVDTPT